MRTLASLTQPKQEICISAILDFAVSVAIIITEMSTYARILWRRGWTRRAQDLVSLRCSSSISLRPLCLSYSLLFRFSCAFIRFTHGSLETSGTESGRTVQRLKRCAYTSYLFRDRNSLAKAFSTVSWNHEHRVTRSYRCVCVSVCIIITANLKTTFYVNLRWNSWCPHRCCSGHLRVNWSREQPSLTREWKPMNPFIIMVMIFIVSGRYLIELEYSRKKSACYG